MITFTALEDIEEVRPTAVALGNFDGVHLGHQKLIRDMVRCAKKNGLVSCVFTFSNHPRNLIKGLNPVKNIMTEEEKRETIASLGVEVLVDIPFTEEVMRLDPVDFVYTMLLDRLNMKAAFCGFNYRFGFKAEGTPDILRNIGIDRGYKVHVMKPFQVDGDTVSSTLIRTMIAGGQLEYVKKYMGRNYTISGSVVVGNKLGRKLGFPTLNLNLSPAMVTPPNGVYVTFCYVNGVRYPSVTNVGVKPTIGTYDKNVETHIFDFNENLYGQDITVEFLRKTRDEVKFDSVGALSDQIVRDCRDARRIHKRIQDREERAAARTKAENQKVKKPSNAE